MSPTTAALPTKKATMPKVSDLEVWRAANRLIKQFPIDPAMEAAQRADHAYEQGDMSKFNLWTRINKAVRELERTKPGGPNAIH
jgi:hypothetical protein